jgi:aspartyl protease family protein
MRQILILACVLLAAGAYAARYADRFASAPATQEAAAAHVVEPSGAPASFGRNLTLDGDRQGHFQAEARVDGARIKFMVDTGASLVTLRETDAADAGIRPSPSDYTARVATANGTIKAAPAKLRSVEIGDIVVFDVQALVLPDEVLPRSLLGVSFLSRLKRYEYANGRMVLEQ